MRKKIATILTIVTAFGFAQDAIPEILPKVTPIDIPARPFVEEKSLPKKSFSYLKMGVSDTELNQVDTFVLPGFGIGYRLSANASAIDISASYNYRKYNTDLVREDSFHYVFPKLNYLYYFSGAKDSSFYTGAGLAWGGARSKETGREKINFIGLISNIAFGYEINRTGVLRSFIQLDLSQATIAAYREGPRPKPYAELAVGGGF